MSKWPALVVQSELIADAITRRDREPALKLVETFKMPDPHQTKTVLAGKQEQVFYFSVPKGHIFFTQRVANAYWYNDYLYWYMDGKLKESPYIQRVIGTVNLPLEITPWFVLPAKEDIRWEVKNNDTKSHDYEILIDGFYVRQEDLPTLFRLTGVRM